MLPQTSKACNDRYDESDTCKSYQGTTYGDYVIPRGYTISRGSMQFDDPDLDDEFFAFNVIRNVDFPRHVGRKPETRPDHKDYKGVQFEPGMRPKGITVVKTPNSMIGSKKARQNDKHFKE